MGPSLRLQIADFDIEIVADRFLNILDGDFPFRPVQRISQDIFCQIHANRCLGERGERSQASQRAFQLTHIGIDIRRQEDCYIVR